MKDKYLEKWAWRWFDSAVKREAEGDFVSMELILRKACDFELRSIGLLPRYYKPDGTRANPDDPCWHGMTQPISEVPVVTPPKRRGKIEHLPF